MDLPAEIARHLDRLRDGLLEVTDLQGLYLYGSLTTGDFSPAKSDIDLIAVPRCRPGKDALARLQRLHLDLASAGGAFGRLNCLYIPAGRLADPEQLHPYWFGDQFTEWHLKLMTMVELARAGGALYGPWPPPGLGEVSLARLQEAVRDELSGYWREAIGHQDIWLQDLWVDFGLVTLARSAAVLRDGALISKSEAIGELAGFGVPAWLSEQIRRRREGGEVDVPEQQRPARARLVRRIMTDGIGRLTRPLREDPR